MQEILRTDSVINVKDSTDILSFYRQICFSKDEVAELLQRLGRDVKSNEDYYFIMRVNRGTG